MSEQITLRVGQNVPHFEMETYDPAAGDFGKFSLEASKQSGRWTVLVFYPADFTFVCPTELADLAAVHSQLKNLGCDVYGVSTDTKFAHLAWRNSEKLLADVQYPLAADPTGAVSKMFGVYDCGSGLALRGTFSINPAGTLVSSEINFSNVGYWPRHRAPKLQPFGAPSLSQNSSYCRRIAPALSIAPPT